MVLAPNPLAALISQYCATATPPYDRAGPGETAPRQNTAALMQNNRVEALIDGVAYFKAVEEEMATLISSTAPGRFFYMSAWWLGLATFTGRLRINDSWDFKEGNQDPNFSGIKAPGAPQTLMWRLIEMSDRGVDVRVMPWVSPFITNQRVEEKIGMGWNNFHTLLSVVALRKRLPAENVVLNLLAHTFGAAHYKMVVCGDQTRMRAYVSGLDPQEGRLLVPGLTPAEVNQALKFTVDLGNQNNIDAAYTWFDDNKIFTGMQDEFKTLWAQEDLPRAIEEEVAEEVEAEVDRLKATGVDPTTINKATIEATIRPTIDRTAVQQAIEDSFDAGFTDGKYAPLIKSWSAKTEWKISWYRKRRDGGWALIGTYQMKQKGFTFEVYEWQGGGWHDVGVRIDGAAAGAVEQFFREMWNEQLTRPVESFKLNNDAIASHDPAWAALAPRAPVNLPANTGRQYVQILRTIPKMNFRATPRQRGKFLVPESYKPKKFGPRVGGKRLNLGVGAVYLTVGAYAGSKTAYARLPVSFAPQGVFEFKVALKTAIAAAKRYIFIADQALTSMEVMDWLAVALLAKPSLKIILLFGADPADPPSNFLTEALNNRLVGKIPASWTNTLSNISFREWYGNTVHCKVTMIDDVWCAVGSANCMRRSLYTDIELSTGILELPTPDNLLPTTPAEEANPAAAFPIKSAPSFVQKFRRDLWAHYCGIPLDRLSRNATQSSRFTQLLNLDRALAIWDPTWGNPIANFGLREEISSKLTFPYPSNPRDPFNQADYDRQDADSRDPF